MRHRVPERVRGLGALVATLALVVVPPLALAAAVGWPLPTSVPELDQISSALERGIDDVVVVKTLATIAWLAWLQVAAAVVVEVLALVRSRPAPRLPVLPGMQLGVARLVAASALVLTSISVARPAASRPLLPLPEARTVASVSVDRPAPELGDALPQISSGRTVAEGVLPSHTVQRGETLWDIAEAVLGDGLRWREVRDLNVDRTMADGSVLGADSDLVRPGWVLLVPTERVAVPAVPAPTVTVATGDHLWAIASDALAQSWGRHPADEEVRPYWEQLIRANRERLADPSDPDLVFAGQEVALPPTPAAPGQSSGPGPAPAPPAPVEPPAEPAPAAPAPGVGSVTEGTDGSPAPEQAARPRPLRARDAPSPAPWGARAEAGSPEEHGAPENDTVAPGVGLLGVAGTALAVGVAHALRRRRLRRLRLLPAGTAPGPPPSELDEVRAELVLSADEDHVARLDVTLRDLSDALGQQGAQSRPRIVQVDHERVEVLLSEPVTSAPPPWQSEAAGSVWVHRGKAQGSDADGPAPAPLLVALGQPEEGRQLYLDLEAESLISLTGDPDEVGGLVRSILLELSTSLLADALAVTVVGDAGQLLLDDEFLAGLDRVARVASWKDAAEGLKAWSKQARDTLEANDWPNTFVARSRSDHDALIPHLAICFERPDAGTLAALRDLGPEGTGATTVLLVGDYVPGALRIELKDERLTLPDLGMACRAQGLDARTAAQVVDLLADADDTSDSVGVDRGDGQLSLIPDGAKDEAAESSTQLSDPGEEYRDPDYHVLVRLLGDITVDGGSRSLTAKQLAVAAYVALHAPVAAERVEDAIWTTPTASRRKRLANTVSSCRAILGAAHFPVATDGRYSVGPKLTTDVELFERRVAASSRQEPELAAETLRGALELVRGPVFAYRSVERSSYVWIDLENWVTTWEVRVIDTALRLAQLCLDVGDIDGAIWAAHQGLHVAPIHTGLTESLMASYHERGDRLAAERIYRSHVNALEQLEIDDVADTTIELYEQIRSRMAAG